MMDDLFIFLVYTCGMIVAFVIGAALADYVGPWLERMMRRL